MYYMLFRIDELKTSLIVYFTNPIDDCEIEDLSNLEWKILSELLLLLQPLESITANISTSFYASISLIIPMISGAEVALRSVVPTHLGIKEIRKKLLFSIEDRFDKYTDNELVTSAALLDPRVKDTCFKDEDKRRKATQKLRDELEATFIGKAVVFK